MQLVGGGLNCQKVLLVILSCSILMKVAEGLTCSSQGSVQRKYCPIAWG